MRLRSSPLSEQPGPTELRSQQSLWFCKPNWGVCINPKYYTVQHFCKQFSFWNSVKFCKSQNQKDLLAWKETQPVSPEALSGGLSVLATAQVTQVVKREDGTVPGGGEPSEGERDIQAPDGYFGQLSAAWPRCADADHHSNTPQCSAQVDCSHTQTTAEPLQPVHTIWFDCCCSRLAIYLHFHLLAAGSVLPCRYRQHNCIIQSYKNSHRHLTVLYCQFFSFSNKLSCCTMGEICITKLMLTKLKCITLNIYHHFWTVTLVRQLKSSNVLTKTWNLTAGIKHVWGW